MEIKFKADWDAETAGIITTVLNDLRAELETEKIDIAESDAWLDKARERLTRDQRTFPGQSHYDTSEVEAALDRYTSEKSFNEGIDVALSAIENYGTYKREI
jgi:hypothetical protein